MIHKIYIWLYAMIIYNILSMEIYEIEIVDKEYNIR